MISCSNDVMNHVDVYPEKVLLCSKNIRGISFFVLKNVCYIAYQENIYHRCYCISISFIQRCIKLSLSRSRLLSSYQFTNFQLLSSTVSVISARTWLNFQPSQQRQ